MDNLVLQLFNKILDKNILVSLKNNRQRILFNNINENLTSLVISYLAEHLNQNIVIVTPNLFQAQKTYDKLVQMLGDTHVYFFPMDEFISAEMLASSNEFRQERINTIVNLLRNKSGIQLVLFVNCHQKQL